MRSKARIAVPPTKPVMVFDGDCRFCTVWVRKWQQITGDLVEYLPFQSDEVAARFPELSWTQFSEAVHLIDTDGSVFYGAEAAFRGLAANPQWKCLQGLYVRSHLFADVTEYFYRLVAEHRTFFSFLTRFFWGNRVESPTYVIARSVFIRSLSVIYLIAFVSLWTQLSGLIGSRGIMPAQYTMKAVRNHYDAAGIKVERFHAFPTLCWFDDSDRSLNLQCAAGAVLAICVFAGIAPAPCLFLLWLTYLSLFTICREFLGFQWDILLLETGFLAIFLAPMRFLPWRNCGAKTPRIIIWLLGWLLFRLMFESGRVKILSHDETWKNLTALTFHYETQPLPTWIGWYAHQAPVWLHKLSCWAMFRVELILPFFLFAPRRLRHIVGVIFIAFQASIFLTGNYCFFNLLTIALCLALFDDAAWTAAFAWIRRRVGRDAPSAPPINSRVLNVPRPWHRITLLAARVTLAALVLFLTVPQLLEMFGNYRQRHQPNSIERWFGPLASFNSYGLFAVMTRPRYEIIVQGSSDGETWLDYEFKYKPGDLKRRPGFVAPHQPRLDWQMWFAALGSYQNNPWFVQFCVKLLQNSPDVLALLKTNPFPEAAPRYIRARLYEYHFTTPATRRATGQWWKRELKGEYLPAISLRKEQESGGSR